ncbi:MAG TPA: hypothetical protein VHY08_26675 [Bacillota bacterium]|nr:hypothetical protein [Bacillota bacterium]
MKIKTSTLDIMKKTRQTWERNPVTRIHDHDPRRNRKKERQNVKQFLRKAQSQDDGAFLFGIKTYETANGRE